MVAVELIGSILMVLLWIVAGLIAFVFVVLCTPLRVSAAVDEVRLAEASGWNLDGTSGSFDVEWLFGLVAIAGELKVGKFIRLRFRIFGIPLTTSKGGVARRKPRSGERRRKENARFKRRHRRRGRSDSAVSLRDLPALFAEGRRLIVKLWRTLRFEATGEMIYGFDDPAVTGACEALRTQLRWPDRFRLVPDFTEARLEGWARIRFVVYPIVPLIIAAGVAFRRGVRRIWWRALKRRMARLMG